MMRIVGDKYFDMKGNMNKRTWLAFAWGMVLLAASERPAEAFYNPIVGRWINRDPIGERGGTHIYSFAGCGCALSADKAQSLGPALVGEWRTREFKSNYEEFKEVTNFTFCVYRIEVLTTNIPPTGIWANVAGEFLVKGKDGRERFPYACYPMWLSGTNQLVAGPRGDALVFNYSLTNEQLVLESREGKYFFTATLKRVKADPGKPRLLPEWAR